MANFARSLKSPSFLSPKRRPAMSGRTLSNSSELSVASNHSGLSEELDFVFSAPGTPALLSPGEGPSGGNQGHHDGMISPHRSSTSHPITIELPQFKRHTSSSVTRTPSEPLSARGDLPGGYFPLHEDPTDRVHRTQPFHHDSKTVPRHSVSAIPQSEHADSRPTLVAQSHQFTSPQISSYLPAGFQDHSLPLGKYYPSNYESRNNTAAQAARSTRSNLLPPSINSDSRISTRTTVSSSSASIQDSEVRRKLLQYQRDMVAQAKMAATEVLGASGDASKAGITLAQRNAALQELRLNAPAPHKPVSPRLLPLGSPGPVTPMDLETGVNSYLERTVVEGSPRTEGLASPSTGPPRRTA